MVNLVIKPVDVFEYQQKVAAKILERALEVLGTGIKARTIVTSGNPAEMIIDLSEKEHADIKSGFKKY